MSTPSAKPPAPASVPFPGRAADAQPSPPPARARERPADDPIAANWLNTYCDMMTLLMCFFIFIVIFSSFEDGKHLFPRKRDSILYGVGGSGALDRGHLPANIESFVWRQLPPRARLEQLGAENPPPTSEQPEKLAAYVLKLLDEASSPQPDDSFALRVPLDVLCESDGTITSSGRILLAALARSIRHLPYDVVVEVGEPERLASGALILKYLYEQERIHPARLSIGALPETDRGAAKVRFLFIRQP